MSGRSIFERCQAVMAENNVTAFDYEDEREPAWRFSGDIWAELEAFTKSAYGWTDIPPGPGNPNRLFGFPMDMDPKLPPNSVYLDLLP